MSDTVSKAKETRLFLFLVIFLLLFFCRLSRIRLLALISLCFGRLLLAAISLASLRQALAKLMEERKE